MKRPPIAAPTAHSLPKVVCDPEEQKKFQACVQTMTNFQPHPLAVIKQPKLIDDACAQFRQFKLCQANISCRPLWSVGMSAMFEYACGQGYNNYIQVFLWHWKYLNFFFFLSSWRIGRLLSSERERLITSHTKKQGHFTTKVSLQVRQCVRKVTTREDVRECVTAFSRGEPQYACLSSNTLLACAQPIIAEKCGAAAGDFVKNYVSTFATAIDPACRIGGKLTGKACFCINQRCLYVLFFSL